MAQTLFSSKRRLYFLDNEKIHFRLRILPNSTLIRPLKKSSASAPLRLPIQVAAESFDHDEAYLTNEMTLEEKFLFLRESHNHTITNSVVPQSNGGKRSSND
ncbi:hypothetical protein TNCT_460821 [Trichonephila clavata]|uniref:Uncharacterized protein n=1 Tax=Trichonephila clavata TaxID=2740835 RepID=A0A8X6LC53_TRICU|nr:hypothetical protein TNCT_460821 [Trichonephila clavata]